MRTARASFQTRIAFDLGLASRLHGRNRRLDHSRQMSCRTATGAIAVKTKFAARRVGFLPQTREYLPLTLRLGDLAGVEDRIQCALRNWCLTMMRNCHRVSRDRMAPYGMASAHTHENIPGGTKIPFHLVGIQRLHVNATARRVPLAFAPSFCMANSRYDSRHPIAASITFARHSSRVAPCEAQPGIAGTSPQ